MTLNKTQIPESCLASVKSRFFAQYYGQEILRWCQWIETTPNGKVDLSIPAIEKDGWFIKLKSLSKLLNEDYSKIAELYMKPIFKSKQNYIEEAIDFKIFMIEEIDFLRSKGYAVPFMEYSVDDLISFGWVQLL